MDIELPGESQALCWMRKVRSKKLTIIWVYLCDIIEKAKYGNAEQMSWMRDKEKGLTINENKKKYGMIWLL